MSGKSRKTLLLVEDELLLAMAEKMELEKCGYAVISVATGEKAIEAVDTCPEIDLVLMDINLGAGIDGTQAAEIILRNHDVPIVFVSSHTEREIVEKTEKITSYGYTVKSSSISVLDASIKMAFKLFEANCKVERSEEYFRHSFENSALGICFVSIDGKFQRSNEVFQKMIGYSEDELTTLESSDITYPEDLDIGPAAMRELLSNNDKKIIFEKRFSRKDKTVLWATVSASLIQFNGAPSHFFIQVIDDNQRKLESACLQENEERYRTLFESMPIGVFYFNSDGKIIFANAAAEDILGITMDEIVTRIHTDPRWCNIHEDGSEFEADYLPSTIAMRTGKPVRNVTIGIWNRRENAYRWVRGSAIPQVHSDETVPFQVYVTMEDVTEHKNAENALLESAEKHRLLVENSHDIIYTLTSDGIFLFVSAAWTALMGYPVDQVVGKSFQVFIHPDDHYRCLEWLHKVIQTGARQEGVEYRVRHADGSWYWHTSSAVPLRDKAGNVIGFEGVARDITERKNIEDILQATRENYESFFNSIDDFLFVLDENGIMIHVNNIVMVRLGYTAQELYGQSVLMLHPRARREEAGRIVSQMLAGTADFCPVPIVSKDGLQIPVETRITHGNWDGKPAIFGVSKDISRLQLSEEKFSKLFHINPSASGLTDLRDGSYIEVNEAFYKLFGFNKNEVIGKTATELGIMTHDSIETILRTADGEGNVTNVDASLKTKCGEIKHVLLSAENIHIQNGKFRFTVVHDITERKKAEDKVNSLLAEKELILKEVHHRIKNNMNTISSLLSLQTHTLTEPSAISALKDTGSRVKSMGLLYDKLYLSKDYNNISLKDYLPVLVDEVIKNFPKNKMVKTEMHIEDVVLDAKRIQPLGIIINELLTNIMKYAFSGRAQGLITVSALHDNKTVIIGVQDDGNGMPENVSFERSPGFGLQLIQALTQQLNGSIRIERVNGTKVVLEFTR